jgi:alpha-amylase
LDWIAPELSQLAEKEKLVWSTSNKAIATVTPVQGQYKDKPTSATIKAIKAGTATITLKAGKKSASFKVVVVKPATSLTFREHKNGLNYVTVKLGSTFKYTPVLNPAGTSEPVDWYWENALISKGNGSFVANRPGFYVVSAWGRYSGTEGGGGVWVVDAFTEIKLNPTRTTLTVGDSYVLKPTVKPNHSNDEITWTSNKPTIATVDPYTGVIIAVSKGTATITGKAGGGKSVKFTVTVK